MVYPSMIFKWFEADIAAETGSLLAFVKRYVADVHLARELDTTPYRVQFIEYDWSLNGLPPSG